MCLTRHSQENFLLITSLYRLNTEGLLFILMSVSRVCVCLYVVCVCVHQHNAYGKYVYAHRFMCQCRGCVCHRTHVEANLGCWSSLSTLSATKSLVCSYMRWVSWPSNWIIFGLCLLSHYRIPGLQTSVPTSLDPHEF